MLGWEGLGTGFVCKYDFGDFWDHGVVVEKIDTVKTEPYGCAHGPPTSSGGHARAPATI